MVLDKNEYRKLDKNEYRKAAKRHLDTCRYMLEHLREIEQADNYKADNILMDIYYLSGYIIECAGSFGMLCLGEKITWINKTDGTERAIHNFQINFIPEIEKQYPNLYLGELIEKSEVEDLYNEWKVEVRYKEKKTLNEKAVRDFVALSEDIYEKIIKAFTGKPKATKQKAKQ